MHACGLLDLVAATQLRRDGIDVGLRLRRRRVVAQATDQAEGPVGPRRRLPVDAQRGVHVGPPLLAVRRREQQLESCRRDADHERAPCPEIHGMVQDAPVAAEAALPELVAEYDDQRRRRRGRAAALLRRSVVLREVAPLRDPHPKQREEVGGDVGDRDLFRIPVVAAQGLPGAVDSGDAHKVRRARAQVLQVAGYHRNVARVPLEEVARDHDQTLRAGIRKRPQQHGVGDAEDRGAGADPERERQDGRARESGVPAKRACADLELPERHLSHDSRGERCLGPGECRATARWAIVARRTRFRQRHRRLVA